MNYSISILTVNGIGSGARTNAVTVLTRESGKSHLVILLYIIV